MLPDRITVTRSEISRISSMRCEMKMTPAPSSRSARTILNSRSRTSTSSADVASSRIRIRGRRRSARTIPHACLSLKDRYSTDRPRSSGRPRSSSIVARARARRSVAGTRLRNSASAPNHTFSSTDRASVTRTSWNTVAMPLRCATAGVRSAGAVLPPSSILPASGAYTPLRIFTSVLLPDPFSPARTCTSPARRSNDAPRSACVRPNALAMSVTDTRRSVASFDIPPVGASTVLILSTPCAARGSLISPARASEHQR